jgi:hypothetical protein
VRRRDVSLGLLTSAVGASCSSSLAGSASSPATSTPYALTPQEQAAGVTPLNYAYAPGRPERYIAAGAEYASLDGQSGTDFTQALQTALDIPFQPVVLGAYNYLFSNLVIPGWQKLGGEGMHHSLLICKPGSTGTMFTDAGGVRGAAKVDIRGVAFYGNNCAYTHGLRLGYNTIAFGTEGVLDQVWVRDLPGGFPGIDVCGNVGEFGFLYTSTTGGLQLIGTALTAMQLESVACSGFQCGGGLVVCNFGDMQIGALEVEANANATTAVYLTGNVNITMLTVSLLEGFQADHLVEIGPGATTWAIQNFKLYFKEPAPVISGGNFKAGSVYFAGNATGANYSGQGNYLSGLMTQQDQFGFKLQQLNAFTLRLQLQGGVLEHLIGAAGAPMMATNLAASVNGASNVPAPTPTAASGFAQGVTISSLNPSLLLLDTGRSGPWQVGDSAFIATIAYNSTGTAYTVSPSVSDEAVSGTLRDRLQLMLCNAATGAAVSWASAVPGEGQMIDIMLLGFLK